jgi:hypothetical protein
MTATVTQGKLNKVGGSYLIPRGMGIELKMKSHGGVPPWNPRKNEYADSGVPLTVENIRGRGEPHQAPSCSPLPLRPHHHSDFPSFLPAAWKKRNALRGDLLCSRRQRLSRGSRRGMGAWGQGESAWGLMGFSLPPASHNCRRTRGPRIPYSGGSRGILPHGSSSSIRYRSRAIQSRALPVRDVFIFQARENNA